MTTQKDAQGPWHPTLPIQINWTYRLDGCSAEIFCPGNVHPWRMARVEAGAPDQAAAYARLIVASPDMHDALKSAVELFECDDETNKPGTDAHAWLHNARAALSKAVAS